jgi:hypothetical protein
MRVHLGVCFIFFINYNLVLFHFSDFYNFLNIFSVNLTFTFSKLTMIIDKNCKCISHCRKLGVLYNFEINCTCHDNLIHIFQNNFPVKCHFQGPPNQQISPIEVFKHFSDVYGSLFYTVVHR